MTNDYRLTGLSRCGMKSDPLCGGWFAVLIPAGTVGFLIKLPAALWLQHYWLWRSPAKVDLFSVLMLGFPSLPRWFNLITVNGGHWTW